jgi:hypothetical protein
MVDRDIRELFDWLDRDFDICTRDCLFLPIDVHLSADG